MKKFGIFIFLAILLTISTGCSKEKETNVNSPTTTSTEAKVSQTEKIDSEVKESLIKDPVLAQVIREEYERQNGDKKIEGEITKEHLESLKSVNDEGKKGKIKDLSGLEFAVNMKTVSLNNQEITDISALASMPNLENVEMTNGILEDATPIQDLKHLHFVNLRKNQIKDITPLSKIVTDYETGLLLNVNDNPIEDFTPATNFQNLYNILATPEVDQPEVWAKIEEIKKKKD